MLDASLVDVDEDGAAVIEDDAELCIVVMDADDELGCAFIVGASVNASGVPQQV